EVKLSTENDNKPDENYYPQEFLKKSAHGISEVKVKIESEVKEELTNIQSVEIIIKEEIEINAEPIHGNKLHQYYNCDRIKHKRTKTRNNLFEYRQCSKAFSNESGFKFHQRMHTGEKLYHCCQCDKAYSQYNTLII
ncbi:unnamed protein product, partial [Meganyctiphanes norvegica]